MLIKKIYDRVDLWNTIKVLTISVIIIETVLGIAAAVLLSSNAGKTIDNIEKANAGNLSSICANVDNIIEQYSVMLKNGSFVNSLMEYTQNKQEKTGYTYTMEIRAVLREAIGSYVDMLSAAFVDRQGEVVVYETNNEAAQRLYSEISAEEGFFDGKCTLYMDGRGRLILFKRINYVDDQYNMYTVGDVMIELDRSVLDSVMNFEKIGSSEFFICDKNRNILSCSDDSIRGKDFFGEYKDTGSRNLLQDGSGVKYVASYKKSDKFGINVIAIYPYAEMAGISEVPIRFIIIMAIISILTLVMLWITFLMLSRKEKDSYILEVKIRDAQIRECEKQINPHFLYNSLQMIQMLGLMRDFDGLQEAIVSLGDVLRYSLNGEREVAITSEIENIESYFRLLKLRYRERLDYSIVCEDDFTQYKMLKFILQPLVENAVKHGFETAEDKCRIDIRIKEFNDGLVLVVHDTGSGIEPERLEKIQAILGGEPDDEGFVGIGLKNINDRIKLYYGSRYGVMIKSEYGVKTDVMVHIPICFRGDENV